MKLLSLAALLSLVVACEPTAATPTPIPATPSPTVTQSPIPSPTKAAPSPTTPVSGAEPDHVTVQHLLISFKGTRTKATRTQEEAKDLAEKLYARITKGENFDALIKEFTDDSPPGIYKMANKGVKNAPGEYSRTGMVAAFGDVGFKLKVGEYGMSTFDPKTSPFGWHIIKRIE